MTRHRPTTLLPVLVALLVPSASACSSVEPLTETTFATEDAFARTAGISDAATFSGDASRPDASGSDAAGPDDPVVRRTCTNTFGRALSRTFGRLDGTLVAIVGVGASRCHGDSGHVHLQVEAGGATYDVAVNTDGLSDTVVHTAVGESWNEGWHAGASLDYVADLGTHAAPFQATRGPDLEASLASVARVSVYATGYGPGGAHLVHRNGAHHDGALVLDPTSPSPRFVLFRFANQAF